MYAVSIEGHDGKGKTHYVETEDFKYIDSIYGIINDAIDDITGAPWFCDVDSVSVKNTETSLIQMFELNRASKENVKIEVRSLVRGWIARDARFIPEKNKVFDNSKTIDITPFWCYNIDNESEMIQPNNINKGDLL